MLLSKLGISKRTENALAKKQIRTSNDIVKIFPKSYRNYQEIHPIQLSSFEEFHAFSGTLIYCSMRFNSRPYVVMRIVQDDGVAFSATLFNEVYKFETYFNLKGREVVIYGKPDYSEEFGWSVKYPYNIQLLESFKPHIEPIS